MNPKTVFLISGLLFALLPVPAAAQCKDQLCSSVQNIFDAAVIDFRGYRAHTTEVPDISTPNAKIPCQITTWANNVPMCICYAQVPFASGADWYARTLDVVKSLNTSWHFNVRSPGDNHYVDAGPTDCEITPTEGPYIGQCPLHLEITKQNDGSAKLYLMMNSLSSPFLLQHIVPPASKAVPPAKPVVAGNCDDFCQGLKKAFEARTTGFENLHPAGADATASPNTLKLAGARECSVSAIKTSPSGDAGTQYVCYWQEASNSAADTRFRDLIALLQFLVPSNWAAHQANEIDEQSGANLTAWRAEEPGNKHDVRVYLAGNNVALHITAWK